jgi:hypothetical protein
MTFLNIIRKTKKIDSITKSKTFKIDSNNWIGNITLKREDVMKKLLILTLISVMSTISWANGLNGLVEKIIESANIYNSIELSSSEATEAQIRIRSGISGFIASQELFGKDKKLEKELVEGLANELSTQHFAGLVKIGRSGMSSNTKPVDNLLKKVCLSFDKEKQTRLSKEESIKCKNL